MPRPSRALTVDHRRCRRYGGAGEELAHVGARQLEQLVVDEVGLGQRHDAARARRAARGWPRARRVCGITPSSAAIDEQEEVDAGGAGDHGAHEALVAGHVDDAEPAAAGQLQLRVAELDRDAALPLLAQAVGVLAGEERDERRLAVVDVPGGAEREGARRQAQPESTRRRRRTAEPRARHAQSAASTAAASSSSSSSRTARRSSSRRPSCTRPTTAGAPRAQPAGRPSASPSGGVTATATLGTSVTGSAPAPARATESTSSTPAAPALVGGQRRTSSVAQRAARQRTLERRGQHGQRRDALDRPRRVEVEAQQRVERRQVELVDAQGARQRVAPHGLDRRGRAHGDAGLRAAEQLVAAEGDDVGAGGEAVARRRLLREQLQVGQGAAAEVVDQHGAALVRQRRRARRAPARR